MEDVAIQSYAKDIILMESKAIQNLEALIDKSFSDAVKAIFDSKGRVIITGIGKSAIIATKIVATLNSTGTPAVFMHAADAIHGDLGTILKDDIVICISKSGNTPEIKVLAPLIKNFKNTLIAITGNKDSFLGKQADFVLNTFVEKEACPNNLAPTTSTTAQLVMGDALAVCLLKLRGFSRNDFAKFHPGGALGKTLYLRVSDITSQNMKPQVNPETPLKDVIIEISTNMLGVTAVLENDEVIGIITDGDLRRMLSTTENFTKLKAKDIMTKNPKTIANSAMAIDALDLLETYDITQLISHENGKYAGVVHLHNLVKEGII
ncbi:D-arabinose 5-phosphate isomerase associated with LPS/capsule synthesis, KpsF/GutQ family [Psychroflexus torquis ATCC 700755]|uniref:D-arabinose 5-phosphate isomerase associated with LPS/capsule synthesis, KpsF/GutQ family n=1 Tax=Psychroflexus torquis (strain ATCC 700755 / CIP 106069 / ACAM 623) TaxID=313595 RepID=K4IHQ8_PSYTT|nr:KpsF/GutQ family sugar-phosphate isomerase [Psychroflexus torquis]AFU69348.1 D-arabinose 5-phosphate isomerase associated with LPS/capsule synthesis, KpsF/GutQ family [Psychroflexus torquis ATCC 700755]